MVLVVIVAYESWPERDSPSPIELPADQGDLARFVSDLVDAEPGRGSVAYVDPSSEEASEFAALASSMEAGDLEGAEQRAEALKYTLVQFKDAPTGRDLLVAREDEVSTYEAKRG